MDDQVRIGDKLYRRKPWKGHAKILILVGEFEPGGDKPIPPRRITRSKDPIKKSKAQTKPENRK